MKNLPFALNKAFTLIELLIVIAVLGVLATMVIVRFTGPQATARDTKRKAELRQYQAAVEAHANRNNSLFHNTGGNTVNMTSICGILGTSVCPDDPNAASGWESYRYQSSNGGLSYVIWGRLEKPSDGGNNVYFVLCSNGNAGERSVSGFSVSGGNCPI